MKNLGRLGGLALVGLASASAVSAQSVIRITNVTPNRDIPLATGSTVQFDTNGNVLASCALTAGVCTALSGPTGSAPTVTFTRGDSDTEVTAGETVRLAWTSTSAAVCFASSTGTTNTSFGGPRDVNNSPTGESVTLNTQGEYSFSLKCYNDGGASATQTLNVSVGAPANNGGTVNCSTTGPLIAPSTLTRVDKTWEAAFSAAPGAPTSAVAVYPNSIGTATPVGANKGTYTVIPFTPNSANLTVNMFFDPAQASSAIGYTSPRPALAMFVGLSPCPGDLRPPAGTADPFEGSACRRFNNTGSLTYSTFFVGPGVCKLEVGQQYFINVAPIDTSDGLQVGEDSCGNSLTGCDVQMRHTASSQ